MAKFRKKPKIEFQRKRAVTLGGLTPGEKLPTDRSNIFAKETAYADTGTPLPREYTDDMKAADETFINLAGVLSKAGQVTSIAEMLPKALFIPVDPNAADVKSAVIRLDRANSPNGDKIYFDLFRRALDHALEQFKFVNLELISKMQNDPFSDANLYSINWTANNVGTIPPANGSVQGSASGTEQTPGQATLNAALKRHDVPFIAKVMSLGAPIIMLWLAALLVKPFQTPTDQGRVGPKQPAGAEWPGIVIQLVIGIAIYILLHGLTKEEAKKVFGMLIIPGMSDDDLNRCIDDGYAVATGGKSSDGKELKDYPLGVPEEFLKAAMLQMGQGDWEIVREYSTTWLINNIHDDKYFAWHMYMDSKMIGHDLSAALDTAPYYSPVFRQQAAKAGVATKTGGGYFPKTSPSSTFDRSWNVRTRKAASGAALDAAKTAATGFTQSSLDLKGFTDLDNQDDRDWAIKNSDVVSKNLNGNPTANIFQPAEAYLDEQVQKLGNFKNFLDNLSRISNETLEDIMAMMSANNWIKEYLCCFVRFAAQLDPHILRQLKLLLQWLGKKIEYDLGSVLKKLYDKYWVNLINELKLQVHSLLDEEWQKILDNNLTPLLKNADVQEFRKFCYLLDMFLNILLQGLGEFKAKLEALVDEMFDSLVLNSDLFSLKIKVWVPGLTIQFMAKLLDIVINFIEECGVPETTDDMSRLEQILSNTNFDFFNNPPNTSAPGTVDSGIRNGINLDDPGSKTYDILYNGGNGSPGLGPISPSKESRPHNILTVYGQKLDLPAEYDKATPTNSWWFGQPKEFDGGFILMPIGAILEGKHKDEKISEEQKKRCVDLWGPEALKAMFNELPGNVLNPRTSSQFGV
jgi:hypothetical protein